MPNDIIRGAPLDAYIAFSRDEVIRRKSASGGVVTALLRELISKKEFEQAFVLKWEKFDGKRPKVQPTDNPETIISASKSKYLPASVEEVIFYLKMRPDSKIIVVATPCQIHGILKYLRLKKMSPSNILFLGLFCDKTLNLNFLQWYHDMYARNGEKIEKFYYRDKEAGGWPGDTRIIFDSGREVIIDRNVRINLKKYFQLTRCLYCFDKFNQLADISFGDCYIRGEKDMLGKSNLIIWTKKGNELVQRYSYLFNIKRVEVERIYQSQNIGERYKNLVAAQVLSKRHNIYPDLIRDSFEISKGDVKWLAKCLEDISYGKKYLIDPMLLTRAIQRENRLFSARLRRAISRIINILRVSL
jgi:coenzyme F420 hydrogenase subunit beta